MIIMLTGLKQSGKSTVAKYIETTYNFSVLSFAKKIKDVSHCMFGWEEKDDELLKETIDEAWGISRREFWQWFGTEAIQYSLPEKYPKFAEKIGRGFWARVLENEIINNRNINYVISDYRFPLEQQILSPYNPITIKVVNPSLRANDLHESEKYIQDMECDYIIYNNSTLQKLYDDIDKIMMELMA